MHNLKQGNDGCSCPDSRTEGAKEMMKIGDKLRDAGLNLADLSPFSHLGNGTCGKMPLHAELRTKIRPEGVLQDCTIQKASSQKHIVRADIVRRCRSSLGDRLQLVDPGKDGSLTTTQY